MRFCRPSLPACGERVRREGFVPSAAVVSKCAPAKPESSATFWGARPSRSHPSASRRRNVARKITSPFRWRFVRVPNDLGTKRTHLDAATSIERTPLSGSLPACGERELRRRSLAVSRCACTKLPQLNIVANAVLIQFPPPFSPFGEASFPVEFELSAALDDDDDGAVASASSSRATA